MYTYTYALCRQLQMLFMYVNRNISTGITLTTYRIYFCYFNLFFSYKFLLNVAQLSIIIFRTDLVFVFSYLILIMHMI